MQNLGLAADPRLSKLRLFWKYLFKLNDCWCDLETTRAIEIKANEFANWSELSQDLVHLTHDLRNNTAAKLSCADNNTKPAFFAMKKKKSVACRAVDFIASNLCSREIKLTLTPDPPTAGKISVIRMEIKRKLFPHHSMRLVSVDERSALIKFFSFSLSTAHFSEEKDCWLVKIVVMFFFN